MNKKKILASLLISPLAIGAFGLDIYNTSTDVNQWTPKNVQGGTLIVDGGVLLVPAGMGDVTYTMKLTAPGTYTLTFVGLNNAKATIVNQGETLTAEATETIKEPTLSVTVKEEKGEEVVITLSPINSANPFGIDKVDAAIDFDFKALAVEYDKMLGEIVPTPIATQLTTIKYTGDAVKLGKEYDGYIKDKNSCLSKVAELNTDDVTKAEKAYQDYHLWKETDDILALINALKAKVEAYNDKADAENAKYANYKANYDAEVALNKEADELKTSLDAIAAKVVEDADDYTYVKGQTDDEKEAAQALINDFKAKIAAAYSNRYKPEAEIEAPDMKAEIEKAIKAYDDAITVAKADFAAFTYALKAYNELTGVYNQAATIIAGLKGVGEDYENLYEAMQAAWQVNVKTAYTAVPVITEDTQKEGASETFGAAYLEKIATATAAIAAIQKEAEDYTAARNKAYSDALDAIAKAEKTMSPAPKNQTDEAKAEFEELQAAYDKALADVNKSLTDKYTDLAGTENDKVTVDLTELNAAITAFNDAVEKWEPILGGIDGLKLDLKDLTDYIAKADKDNDWNGLIASKFAGNIDEINKAIDAAETSAQIAALKDQIATQKANAEKLVGALVDAEAVIEGFTKYEKAFTKYVNDKEPLLKNGAKLPEVPAFATDLAKFKKDLADAKALNSEECYQAALKLKGEIDAYGYQTKVNDALKAFEIAGTQNNIVALQALLDKATKDMNENYKPDGKTSSTDYEGYAVAKAACEAIQVKIDKLTSELATASALPTVPVTGDKNADVTKADNYVNNFTNIDKQVPGITNTVEKAQKDIDNMIASQVAYNGLQKSLADVKTAIDELRGYNATTALHPARKHFTAEIDTLEDETLKAVTDSIEAALKKYEVAKNKKDFENAIKGLNKEISDIKTQIKANEDAHTSQLQTSESTRGTIESAIAYITDYNKEHNLPGVSDVEESVASYLDRLQQLLDVELTKADRVSYDDYSNGVAADSKADGMYKAIAEDAGEIKKEFGENYGSLVEGTNAKIVNETLGWPGIVTALEKQYKDAVNDYNQYYGLNDDDFRKAMLAELKNHEGIFQYVKDIDALKAAAQEFVDKKDEAQQVIWAYQFSTKFISGNGGSTAIAADMTAYVEELEKAAYAVATNYYDVMWNDAFTQVKVAKATLVDNGVDDELAIKSLYAAYEHLTAGTITNMPATAWEAAEAVDAAAPELAKVAGSIDLKATAVEQWKQDYSDVQQIFSGLKTQLEGFEFADNTLKETNSAKLGELIDDAADINTEALAADNLIDTAKNLKFYQNELAGKLRIAYGLVQAVKDSNDGNKANIDLYDEYTNAKDGYIPVLKTAYQELVEYTYKFAANADNISELDSVQGLIDALTTYVENNKSNLVSRTTILDRRRDAIETAISNAYGTVVSNEEDMLKTLLAKVKVLYNSAKAEDNGWADDGLVMNTRINKVQSTLDSAKADYQEAISNDTKTEAAADAYQEDVLPLEGELCNIYSELEVIYKGAGTVTIESIITALADEYAEVKEAIEKGQAQLADCADSVKATYTAEFEELMSDLNDVQEAWINEGNKVLINSDVFSAQMKDILDEVEPLVKKMQADQAVAEKNAAALAASQALLDGFKEAYDKYYKSYEDLNNFAEGEGLKSSCLTDLKILLYYTENQIAYWEEGLKNGTLIPAGAQFPYESDIQKDIRLLTYGLYNDYAVKYMDAASEVLDDAEYALKGNIVPEQLQTLTAALQNYLDEFGNVENAYTDAVDAYAHGEHTQATAEDAAEVFKLVGETAADLAQAVKEELLPKIKENIFTPGDVNLAPDGEVNVTDVQLVITWVGEGVTAENYTEKDITAAQFAAADINHDSTLNIADVAAVINIAMDQTAPASAEPRLVSRRALRKSDSMMSMLNMGTENGITTYALTMSNREAFVAGQFDISLGAGLELVDITLADRAADHSLFTFDNADGARVIIASMENAAIAGNDGAVVYLQVSGSGSIDVDNIYFAEGTGAAVELKSDIHTSMLDSLYEGAKELKQKIYNVAGQAVRSFQRGINIIRNSDGTTTKEFHK